MFPVLVAGNSTSTEYQISNSVRLRAGASAYFNRTFSTTGNQRQWTWSSWFKFGDPSFGGILLQQYTDTANQSQIRFGGGGGNARFYDLVNSVFVCDISWSPAYRDPSAWYHIVFAVDTTQSTDTNRIKFYVNGVQQTATISATWPAQNSNLRFNGNTPHFMNQNGALAALGAPSAALADSYRTETNFIDGQALTPNSFGEFSTTTGIWQPKRYTGNYGVNGFYLKFNDNSAATAAAIGKDSSGNNNNWTPNGISLATSTIIQSFTATTTTTWVAPPNVSSVNYLVVAGGAAGGTGQGGGGGGGGFRTGTLAVTPGASYTVTVGAGGTATATDGNNGSDSVFSTITSTGGGGGVGATTLNGKPGGSGGGASDTYNSVGGTGGAASPVTSPVQGFAGGSGSLVAPGGGGGAGAVGGNGSATNFPSGPYFSGAGGVGATSSISGTSVTYAGGGGGGGLTGLAQTNPGAGGSGGGGAGSTNIGAAGTANLGGGGGGGGTTSGGNGGSGIVILSWAASATTYDSMIDTPSMYKDGGNNRGNYAVLNPLDLGYSATLSDANLKVLTTVANNAAVASTIAMATNTYWEVTIGSNTQIGLLWGRASDAYGSSSLSVFASGAVGSLINATRTLSATPSWANGDTLGFAWNTSARTLTLYQAGSATAVMTIATPATGNPQVAITNFTSSAVMNSQVNFGQRPFTYTPPTGFKTLNTFNLSEPTIIKGKDHFSPLLWTGLDSGTSRSISGTSFAPDMIWTKNRSSAYATILYDRVRGAGAGKALSTFTQTPENVLNTTQFGFLSAFSAVDNSVTWSRGSAGASATKPDGYAYYDQLNNAYVSWNWKVNGTTSVTNTAGTIQSQVSINSTAGVSVVRYTGNGVTNATIGHGLGVAPNVIICHNLDVTSNWRMYHSSLPVTFDIIVNSTAAQDAAGQYPVRPTSQVFTVTGSGGPATNGTGNRQLAYCFSEVAGYSKFSKYTGNGSADGPFLYCGFRPAFVMTKRTDNAFGGDWYIYDTVRNTYNVMTALLYINSSAAEGPFVGFDALSNGFKVRSSAANFNASGGTYIFMAFAENPFKYSLAR